MRKIIHVLNSDSFSGAENVAISIINGLKGIYDWIYVSMDGTIHDVLKASSIKFYPIENLNTKNLKRAVQDIKPDIIHAHDYTAGIISSFAHRGTPIINHLHNNSPWIKQYGLYSFAYAASSLKYKKILLVSDAIEKGYVFGNIIKKKTSIIGNPIDVNHVKELANQVHTDEIYDVVFLGRLPPQKKRQICGDYQ